MGPAPGTYELGPDAGTLELRTYRDGLAQAAGHDLVLAATRWHGTATVTAAADGGGLALTVDVTVEPAGLVVREGTGGLVALTDRDRDEIGRHLRRTLSTDRHPQARFHATATLPPDAPAATVTGELTLAGRTAPLDLHLTAVPVGEDALRVTCSATVRQTAWGVRPYAGLFGALKVRDDVDLAVIMKVPGGSSTQEPS